MPHIGAIIVAMCLILLSLQQHPDLPLIIAANRDEFYSRPSTAAHFWPDHPNILAGRDNQAGGTWLGVSRKGRFAAVTNVRGTADKDDQSAQISRGELTRKFLTTDISAANYIAQLQEKQHSYAGFNLLLGQLSKSEQKLFYHSNRPPTSQTSGNAPRELSCSAHRLGRGSCKLSPGTYGLSNGTLNEAWPKVAQGKQALEEAINPQQPLQTKQLAAILWDQQTAEDQHLPHTGISIEQERLLSSRFIRSEFYGTRSSTVLMLNNNGRIDFYEKTFLYDEQDSNRNKHIIEQHFTLEP